MKVLTYGSYGGSIPDAVLNFLKEKKSANGISRDMHISQDLVALVESFQTNLLQDEETIRSNPDKLYLHKVTCEPDGIRRTYFYGWASPDEFRVGGVIAQVCVNEYQEGKVKTIITEYDGAESLALLPEFEPVDGAFGLYRRKKEATPNA